MLAPFLVSRAVVLLTASFLQWLFDSNIVTRSIYVSTAPLAPLSATFDANWYAGIAAHGFSTSSDVSYYQNYHFFPLYPAALRFVGVITGLGTLQGGYEITGVVLSHLFFLIGLVLLNQLVLRLRNDAELATRTVWITAVLPWSYVFSMTYTESLFLALSLGATLVAYKATVSGAAGRSVAWPWLAGLLAALAALTRPQGFLVAALVVWLVALAPRGLARSTRIGSALAGSAPAFLAVSGWAIYLGISTGNVLALTQSSAAWGRGWIADLPRLFAGPSGDPMWPIDALETLSLLVWATLTVILALRGIREYQLHSSGVIAGVVTGGSSTGLEEWGFILYACANLLLTLVSNPANGGWGRYLVVVFPCAWLVARLSTRSLLFRRLSTTATIMLGLQVVMLCGAVVGEVTP